MNKITLSVLFSLGCLSLFSPFGVQAFNISTHSSLYSASQCAGSNVTVRTYYNTPFQPRDEFTSTSFVQLQPVTSATITDPAQTTRIGIYNPSSRVDCGNMNNWIYPSIAVPADKVDPAINTVVSIAKWPSDLCRVVSLPASRDEIVAQFVFVNAYREVTSYLWAGTSWTVGVTRPVAPTSLLPLPTNYTIVPDYNLSNTVKFERPECLNIQVSWCGDGVLDVGKEICDYNDVSHVGWGNDGCSTSCVPKNRGGASCSVGTTSGAQSAPLTSTSAGLCTTGSTVGAFTATPSGNRIDYSWSCNGIHDGNCTASYARGGASCSVGTTSGAQSAPLTATSAGLCTTGSTVGAFTATPNDSRIDYSWSCNGIHDGNCTASYTPSGGGGGGSTCIPGSAAGARSAPLTATSSGLCAAGSSAVGNFTATPNGNGFNYTWSCGGSYGASCSAVYTPSGGGGGGGGTPTTVPGSTSYCGNGLVERPNARGQYENCDTNAAWCVDCNIASTTPGSTPPGNVMITNPGNANPIALSDYRLIVGNNVTLFPNNTIIFEAAAPMYLEDKVATITNNSPLISGQSISKSIDNRWVGGKVLFEDHKVYDAAGNVKDIVYKTVNYPKTLVLFNEAELENFRGDTSSFASNANIAYRDTPKSANPSLAPGSLYASLQFLESSISVRVSKPVVSNTSGGNAFIARPVGYDLNTIVWSFLSDLRNGNFTTTAVNTTLFGGGRNLTSATQTVSNDANINTLAMTESTNEQAQLWANSGTERDSWLELHAFNMSDILSNTEKLSDNESVRVRKAGSLSIDGVLSLKWIRTIIVENGDLKINQDIVYADKTASYAFIVKKGDIIIADNVKNLAGVYVTLSGVIKSNSVSTTNRLSVDGSFYGDSSDLVEKRTYVRWEMGDSALNVGVIIDYSNRSLVNPPPFLTRFLKQYSLQKVAR